MLNDQDSNIDHQRFKIEHVSNMAKSKDNQNMNTIHELEKQINGLIKSVSRAEAIIDDKEDTIGTF